MASRSCSRSDRYGSSEIVQHRLDRSTVVKTLNHIGYHELEDERRPVGSPERRALGVASDDPDALDIVGNSSSGPATTPFGSTA